VHPSWKNAKVLRIRQKRRRKIIWDQKDIKREKKKKK